jgi:hypothetical protein
LSADQMKKLDARRDGRFESRLGRRVERADDRADAHLEWLDSALELTDAQASQVKAALVTMGDAQEAAFKGVQANTLAREAAHEQMGAAHDAFRESLKTILTTEQETRFEMLQKLFPGRLHHA